MLQLIAAASLACASTPPISPPDQGASFVFGDGSGLYVHERIVSSDRDGAVALRMMPTSSQTPPGAALWVNAPGYTTFMGMILIENRSGEDFRRRTLPENLLDQINRLEPGQTASFDMRHNVRLRGRSYATTQTHEITLLGCGTANTSDGPVRTRHFGVSTAGVRWGRSGFEINRSQKRVDISVDHGWAVYVDDGAAPLSLVSAEAGR